MGLPSPAPTALHDNSRRRFRRPPAVAACERPAHKLLSSCNAPHWRECVLTTSERLTRHLVVIYVDVSAISAKRHQILAWREQASVLFYLVP